jgi:hypothetical protein
MALETPRRKLARKTQVESLEDRLVMSANPLGGLLGSSVNHHAIDDGPNGTVQQHQLKNHAQSAADFWIDPSSGYDLEQHVGDLEQSLSSAHAQTGLGQVQTDYGFYGSGQTVAVIDSGVAYTHYALGGGFGEGYRVVGGYDFTESGAGALDPYDDGPNGGHGTHVSGIVGGNAGSNSGVAPQVDLVGLRVFDDAGAGYFSWVEQALDWVHDNRNAFDNPITAVNLSLGTDWNADTVPNWAMLEDEFAQLKADGIFISVSAGNSFDTYGTAGLSYPAASSHVVPVMSTDDNGSLSYFSQRHERAIAAPGRWITSSVPDYAAGDADTIDDDFATWSGTSMAAPYVAGASVIIRQAMEFVGYTNITQDTIYDHIVSTADQFYDSATAAWYNRLNLESAIDALMPADDFGSSIATAYNLGTVSDSMSMSGTVGMLNDADYFSFTAASSGTVTFTASNMTHELDASWSGTGTVSGDHNESFTIDVVAGQSYSVGLSTNSGLGHYALDITAESAFSYTDWGAVSFNQLTGQSVANDTWYRVEAGSAGYLTVEAMFNAAGGQVGLELYNSNMQVVDAQAPAGGTSRVDTYSAAGEEWFIKIVGSNSDVDFRLTNLVSVSGSTVNILGTSAADTFTFVAGSTHQVGVNGVDYDFASGSVSAVNFAGGGGSDSIAMTGTTADEYAVVRTGNTTFFGAGVTVAALQIENVAIDGGGGSDIADLYDGAGDDTFVAHPTWAQLSGAGYAHLVSGFDEVNAYASGGNDQAVFYDSTGDDTYVGGPTFGRLHGNGFYNDASGFDTYQAYASAGNDRAVFYDSAGDDTYVTTPNFARFHGNGFYHQADSFGRTDAYATAGGDDRAIFYDSAGDDEYVGRGKYARLAGDGFFSYANGFDRIDAYASTGMDLGYFYDTAGDDVFVGRPDYARLSGDGFFNYAAGFDKARAYASSGMDLAYFYDSVGDDIFIGNENSARLYGDGFLNYAKGFDKARAYANAGGNDKAYLYGSAGSDIFLGNASSARMYGSSFLNYTNGFEDVEAHAGSGGNDTAVIDTVLSDESLIGLANIATANRSTAKQMVCDFTKVTATIQAGAEVDMEAVDLDFVYEQIGA